MNQDDMRPENDIDAGPAATVSQLAPRMRVLVEHMAHVMAIQAAFSRVDIAGAGSLLRWTPAPLQKDTPVPYEAWLRNVSRSGRVETEIERLQKLATDALQEFTYADGGNAARGIIFGFRRAAELQSPRQPMEPAPPSPYRR